MKWRSRLAPAFSLGQVEQLNFGLSDSTYEPVTIGTTLPNPKGWTRAPRKDLVKEHTQTLTCCCNPVQCWKRPTLARRVVVARVCHDFVGEGHGTMSSMCENQAQRGGVLPPQSLKQTTPLHLVLACRLENS
eukprot:2551645-Amphidinium_carterae.1